ncbi:MAG: hypothetical protein R3E02_05900 [Blastomonas sp.]
MIAIVIYWDDCKYEIVFNGPEAKVRPEWREGEHRAKEVSVKQMLAEQAALPNNLKLKPVLQPTNKEID